MYNSNAFGWIIYYSYNNNAINSQPLADSSLLPVVLILLLSLLLFKIPNIYRLLGPVSYTHLDVYKRQA